MKYFIIIAIQSFIFMVWCLSLGIKGEKNFTSVNNHVFIFMLIIGGPAVWLSFAVETIRRRMF